MDDVDLTKRVCAILAMLPGWHGPDRADHPGAKVAIFYGAIPPTPDRAVGVRVYGLGDRLGDGRIVRRVQLRFRGDPNEPAGADALASIAGAVLDGISRGAGINGAIRNSMALFGADKNGREERADNYSIILDNQEASTT